MKKWFKKWFGKKPHVIDGNEAFPVYTLYINSSGKLIAKTSNLYAQILGVGEWLPHQKRDRGIDPDVIVLDVLFDPLTYKKITK